MSSIFFFLKGFFLKRIYYFDKRSSEVIIKTEAEELSKVKHQLAIEKVAIVKKKIKRRKNVVLIKPVVKRLRFTREKNLFEKTIFIMCMK